MFFYSRTREKWNKTLALCLPNREFREKLFSTSKIDFFFHVYNLTSYSRFAYMSSSCQIQMPWGTAYDRKNISTDHFSFDAITHQKSFSWWTAFAYGRYFNAQIFPACWTSAERRGAFLQWEALHHYTYHWDNFWPSEVTKMEKTGIFAIMWWFICHSLEKTFHLLDVNGKYPSTCLQ